MIHSDAPAASIMHKKSIADSSLSKLRKSTDFLYNENDYIQQSDQKGCASDTGNNAAGLYKSVKVHLQEERYV
jgi:hypothetical protein